jgi:zinc/manganese transport system permease protein
MLTHEFMRNALLAGSFIALASGLVGYFVVLRSQVFAGDALSHVAFAGALGAAAAGADVRVGLFAATIVVALALGVLGGRGQSGEEGQADDVVIGTVFAFILGLGALFLSIFTSGGGAGNGTAGVNVLFGSIFGLSAGAARLAALLAAGVCVGVLALARPLLFCTVDPQVAAGQGVPVRRIGVAFLVLLGLTSAESAQAVGALLLLGLLAAPAGAAVALTTRPFAGLGLSAGISLGAVWGGLTLAYAIPALPPSTAIVGLAVAVYLVAVGWGSRRRRGAARITSIDGSAHADVQLG